MVWLGPEEHPEQAEEEEQQKVGKGVGGGGHPHKTKKDAKRCWKTLYSGLGLCLFLMHTCRLFYCYY